MALEANYRELEVEQALSLTRFDPPALLQLQRTGECNFSIPEAFFQLAYPGHYRWRVRAVTVTIPCVAGPYANARATLSLTKSSLRTEPKASATKEVPLEHSTAIATSAVQNDSAVFEFSFRDERYMPFEGAGAIGNWRLTLAKNSESFDYRTISDVIIRIGYRAQEDPGLRTNVEH